MKKLLLLMLCFSVLIYGCSQEPSNISLFIIPNPPCKVDIGEDFPISLEGTNMPADAKISWTVTKGQVTPDMGVSVIYTAPQDPGPVIITAILETNSIKQTKTLSCEITATGTSQAPTGSGSSSAIATDTPTIVLSNSIAISEVMAAPCSTSKGPNRNEYVELYNYGDVDIDVNGWWIAVNGGGSGTPDQITSWNAKNPVGLGNNVITDTTIIPPHRFAVILTPIYHLGAGTYSLPYKFPKGTIILTLGNSDFIGNDGVGLLGNSEPVSLLVLYKGTETIMDEVVSTWVHQSYSKSDLKI